MEEEGRIDVQEDRENGNDSHHCVCGMRAYARVQNNL